MKKIKVSHQTHLTIEDIDHIASCKSKLFLSQEPEFKTYIKKGADFLSDMLDQEGYIYGVTTGYGDDCTRPVPLDLVHDLPMQLFRYHGCGYGEILTPYQTRAVLVVRLVSLAKGFSGVSFELLEMLLTLLNNDILPVIPSEGSVGASGDLTPLSYVAAVLSGERRVLYKGVIQETAHVFQSLAIEPYKLLPKEALAIMNGTAVMTGLAIEAYQRAAYLGKFSARLTAMTSIALQGNPQHYDQVLFKAKPHPGQAQVAEWIRSDLENVPNHYPIHRLQDRYSTRCAPHVIGVLEDMLPTFKKLIETELNGASDNPIIDITGDYGRILSGGHFYGGHIAFAMDSLKNIVANIADLLDRQMATLVDPKFNHGLPSNLSGVEGPRACINHGLKAVQISASAWTAEALKGTMPASVFSRSTESHNQDKVSMGTIAARDALRVQQLTDQVCAAHLMAVQQAILLRIKHSEMTAENLTPGMKVFMERVGDIFSFIEEDQAFDEIIKKLVDMIQLRLLPLYGDAS